MINKDNTSDQEFLNNWWKIKGESISLPALKHLYVMKGIDDNSFPLCDLGSGVGVFMLLLEKTWPGRKIFGVDGSDYAVLNKCCSSQIYCADVVHWIPVDSVEMVTMIDVLEHLPDPKKALKNIKTYTNQLIIACPNFNFIKGRFEMLVGRIPFQNKVSRGGHVYWCNYFELKRLFSELSMEIVEEYHIYPREKNKLLRYFFSKWPSVFSHEFIFKLKISEN